MSEEPLKSSKKRKGRKRRGKGAERSEGRPRASVAAPPPTGDVSSTGGRRSVETVSSSGLGSGVERFASLAVFRRRGEVWLPVQTIGRDELEWITANVGLTAHLAWCWGRGDYLLVRSSSAGRTLSANRLELRSGVLPVERPVPLEPPSARTSWVQQIVEEVVAERLRRKLGPCPLELIQALIAKLEAAGAWIDGLDFLSRE